MNLLEGVKKNSTNTIKQFKIPGLGTNNTSNSSTSDSVLSSIFGSYVTLGLMIVLFVLIFIGIYVYFKVFGYTVEMGWSKLKNLFDNGEKVTAQLTEDNEPAAPSISLAPPEKPVAIPFSTPMPPTMNPLSEMTAGMSDFAGQLPFNRDERPSGMPGATERPGFIKKTMKKISSLFEPGKEIFNISRNVYSYDEAAPLCKAMGAELATFEQLVESQKHGADWCNYGWVKGQMAVYPTQEETWNKLQTGPEEHRNSCGKPGLNGGFFDNPELRFGVNCYGPKPQKKDTDELLMDTEIGVPPTAEQIEFDKKVYKFREQLANITVLPFNRDKWSS